MVITKKNSDMYGEHTTRTIIILLVRFGQLHIDWRMHNIFVCVENNILTPAGLN
jgi:hypothetical protein